MHKLSLWQKIGLTGLLLVIAAGLGFGIRYHAHVQADRQHQDQIYQQLDTVEKAKAHFKQQTSEAKQLAALKSMIAKADRYAEQDDPNAKVEQQYRSAIKAARMTLVRQDQAKLKTLTPDAKALAKLNDAKLKQQIGDLTAFEKTIKARKNVVYSAKAYKAMSSDVRTALKTQKALLKKHQNAAKKAVADKKAADQDSTDADSTADNQADTTSSADTATGTDDSRVTGSTASDTGSYTGSTYTGSSYAGNTSSYTGGSGYTRRTSTWRPSSNSGAASTGSTTAASTSNAGSTTDRKNTDNSSAQSSDGAAATTDQSDAGNDWTYDPDK